ncbi:MAG: phosphoribosylformylglycinamidine synthase subunit PurS [Crenarchaeota archaeon]|nr:phosphoribosylformylglycinamidine synthase subunit PurS [Thermoproteota archaeon]MDW8034615.1 phosphoribosylformylglycinamidine synthase subunit PurS [Nitrososphaerota archaeon]
MKVRVEVKLKPGHFDPEGDVTAQSLRDLGFPVTTVKVGKVYILEVEVKDSREATRLAEDMCKKLLANPVKDDYIIEVLST